MGRTLLILTFLALVACLATSCSADDPLGATTREQLRSDTALGIAQAQASAQVESTRIEAAAQVHKTATWAGTLPLLALIVVGGALAGLIVYFQGRAYLIQVQHQSAPASPLLSDILLYRLSEYAARTNQELTEREGVYYLIDRTSGKRVRALPKISAPD